MTTNNQASLSKTTKDILNEYNIKLSKKLGQNYLIDKNKRDQIISFGEIGCEDVVLEIGSGIGTLTLEIARKAKEVVAIEQDTKICKILAKRLEDNNISNVNLINEDALQTDFPYFNKIISNLPYQISSPITFKFLEYDFDMAILMYQKEFVNRMIAKVNTRDYSRLSAMLYFKCDVKKLSDVSCESFIPKPKVDSSIVMLKPKKSALKKRDFENYSKFTRALFQHKNKKIRNALIDSRHMISEIDKKELKKRFREIDSDKINSYLKKRVVELTPEEIFLVSKVMRYYFKV